MRDNDRPRARRSGWITLLVAVVAVALGSLAAVAIAQQGTGSQTETTETAPPSQQPTVPEGFTEEDCNRTTQPDGTQQITCQRQEEAQSEETQERTTEGRAERESRAEAGFEATVTQERTADVDVVPVGGTGAGAGGIAGEDGSALPILIGVGGLAMAGTAVVLARRRRHE